MMRGCFVVLGMMLLLFSAGIAAHAAPSDFIGTWEGQWSQGFLDTTLVVEKIENGEADVIYRWGTSPVWNIQAPGERRLKGRFLDDRTLEVLLFDSAGNKHATIIYRLQKDGALAARYEGRSGISYATMKRRH